MKSALLFRLGGLGDLLVAFPAVSLVHKKFPAAHLTLVCREEYGTLLREAGAVNQTVRGDARRLAPLFSGDCAQDSRLADWLRGFDLVLGWFQERKDEQLEQSLLSLGPKEWRFICYDVRKSEPLSRFYFSETERVLEKHAPGSFPFEECSLLNLEAGSGLKEPGFYSGMGAEKRRVVIHPGSGSEKKCWPLPHFLEIVERLWQMKVGGLMITGEAESRMEETLADVSFPQGWSRLHCPSLRDLAGIFREADLYLGNDSGITHLAAACGTKVVALFRKDLEAAWRPYGRVHLISAVSLEAVSLESVWRLIIGLLEPS